jgi:predicted transcriptional regulator
MQGNTLIVGILAKIQSLVTGRLPKGRYQVPTTDTLLALAKDLGFIEGKRGRQGGFVPTDDGLEFMGVNVDEFRAKEAKSMVETIQERQAAAREARAERIKELQKGLQSALNTGGKHKGVATEDNA